MTKTTLFVDLDNTIYPVSSIGDRLFQPVLDLIKKENILTDKIDEIKRDMMRRPFQKVAKDFNFSDSLTQEVLLQLTETVCTGPMQIFEDYKLLRSLPQVKFLITTGFTKMQQSKVRLLQIEDDFKEIHIVDPQLSNLTKKDVFQDLITRYKLSKDSILVIGDDPNSELKAASELDLDTVLFDRIGRYPSYSDSLRITHFKELKALL